MKRSICAPVILACAVLLISGRALFADAPRICYVSSGGDTSIVIGDGFDNSAKVVVWNTALGRKDLLKYAGDLNGPTALPATPPAGAKVLDPIDVTNDQVLDVSLPDEATVMWVRTAGGISPPRLVNAPQIWLVTDEQPVPGDQMRLFGRNFCASGNEAQDSPDLVVAFRNRSTGKSTIAVTARLSEQYWEHTGDHVIGLIVPEHLAPGPYDILVHAAYSGAFGWSEPYRVDVVAHRSLSAALASPDQTSPGTSIPAAKLTGASGDGLHDDTQAIQSAIEHAAATGGGVVLLPAGEYAITKTLHIEPGVFLRGAGTQATSIVVSPILPMQDKRSEDGTPYPIGMTPAIWIETRSGVGDMSLIGGPGAKSAIFVATRDRHSISQDVSIVRTNITTPERMFRANTGDYRGFQDLYGIWVQSPTRNFTLVQCNIKCGEPLWMDPTSQEHYGATITNNKFEVFPRHGTDNVIVMSMSHMVMEDNDFIGGARAITSQQGFHNCWLFNDRMIDDGGWANAEEMMLSEYAGSSWAGACQTASANTIQAQGAHWKDGQFTDSAEPVFVFINLGKGFGELRRVTGNTPDTITIDAPWDVVPDTTTRFTVLPLTYRNLYINDQAIHCDGRCEFAYGSIAECVVSGLNTRDTEGISSTAVDGGIVAFNDYSYNRLIDFSGIHLQQGDYWDPGFVRLPGVDIGDNQRGNVIGNTIRYNEVMEFRDYPLNQYGGWWDSAQQPAPNEEGGIRISNGSFNVVDDNYVTKGAVGVRIEGGEGNILTHNRIDDVLTPVRDLGRNTLVKE